MSNLLHSLLKKPSGGKDKVKVKTVENNNDDFSSLSSDSESTTPEVKPSAKEVCEKCPLDSR